jgi:hypothetical protein
VIVCQGDDWKRMQGETRLVDTTKKLNIRHVATVVVAVATWPDSHVS